MRVRDHVLIGKRVDDDIGGIANIGQSRRLERPAVGIGLRQAQPFDDDLVVVVDQRALLDVLLRLLDRLGGITRQHALIEALGR